MEPISDILLSLYRGTPEHATWMVAYLQGAWPALLGERIAAACTPVDWRAHTLFVRTKDEYWRDSLQKLKQELLARVQRATGNEVRDLVFRAASDAE